MSNRILHTESVSESIQNGPKIFLPLLNEKFRVLDFFKGETISEGSWAVDRILCLITGGAELSLRYRVAQDVVIDHLDPGDVFGDLSFLTGRSWPSDATLIASENCRFLEISIDRFQRILREIPEFTVELLKSLGKKMVRVDRSDFAPPSKALDPDKPRVCAYPTHPGLPRDVQTRFCDLASTHESIVIVGEKGVGKDILAYAIFDAADMYKEVFVPIDARKMGSHSFSLTDSRINTSEDTSETFDQLRFLFGHRAANERGVVQSGTGYVELAQHGTLYIRSAHRLTP
ncbi:MAG: hypothetical protein QG577_385, partial [Thermodesulfobacteriota bacterium]|nr:hypothetical protein [Thermodesulfobacteriota bacterium]